MNNEIITIIAITFTVGVIIGLPWLFKFRRAFLVAEGCAGLHYQNPALQNLRLMQSLTAAQNGGNTFVLGMPGGFVPLKQPAKPASTDNSEAT